MSPRKLMWRAIVMIVGTSLLSEKARAGGEASPLARLSPTQNLALGMLAGCGSKCINYPLLAWKNAAQQGLPLPMRPDLVYRGLPMAMMNLGGTTAVQFLFTGYFQKMLKTKENDQFAEMAGATLGGIVSGVPCAMWELIMIQQQRFGGSLLGTPAKLLKEFGVAAYTRGMGMTMGREGLYTMAMLGLTPVVQRYLVEERGMDKGTGLAIGALGSAFFSATVTHPMDTIKTCLQGDLMKKQFINNLQTGRLLVDTHGVAGVFKGLGWRISLIATTFFLVNKFKEGLAPVMFPNV
uniref:Mitochondrial carrier protein n=1 Tax=Phaeomonas parva TaxID=124430 RepID=A0A7S1XNY2_9STRA|mmetsp:Transcript_20382/g.61918  ORF Transcript_20382/g.61918 Transcript_20382/m.61918 type:complete len:294 (+) Transcript_20382:68-949(+)|eukprot:CAMPEP_0118872236 /NCGR_PEP_ID=MMETSP1163-20130328/14503_1 /TAXON_ID=124430 /ORGANISM="Phaeomonas parva, Strain CCMP2877" /LENGTH=293 /DNA_ID=CAMNT_0006807405 /DNA_START=28 /DNA_END=909 /DNA_ORIENTATION=-